MTYVPSRSGHYYGQNKRDFNYGTPEKWDMPADARSLITFF